jgi:CRP-like cAMP-binding protein
MGRTVAVIPPIAAVTGDHRVGSFWRRLTDEERVAFVNSARSRRFDTGAELIRAGEDDQWAAVLHSGRVRVLSVGGARAIALRWAGDIVGEQALLDHGKRSATVRAETSVHGLILGRREFDRVVERHPRVMRVLGAVVSERLREADRNLSGQSDDAYTRVAEMLLRYVNEFGSVRGITGNVEGIGRTRAEIPAGPWSRHHRSWRCGHQGCRGTARGRRQVTNPRGTAASDAHR